jgi:glycosyltransferase involved in cell wall biosynthesis
VAPLQIARGVQNKVLEALAMERAVIATPAACQGLATIADEHLICASSADAWCDAALSLLNDRTRREQLASAGRRFVVQHHCWNRCLAPLEQWLGQFLGSPAAHAFAVNVSAHSATPEVALRRA